MMCHNMREGLQGRSEVAEWHDKWQHISKELADVKERAWSLLEEKDLQLQSLKVRLPSCRALPCIQVQPWKLRLLLSQRVPS